MTAFMIPVSKEVKARLKKIKDIEGHTYNWMVRKFLDNYESTSVIVAPSIRAEK